MDSSDDYMRLAEMAAEASGKNFLIGVRPMGKGWFAHCDGIEWDGGTPEMAVRSVVEDLQRKSDAAALAASRETKKLQERAIALAAIKDVM